jgi:hypothetical protein
MHYINIKTGYKSKSWGKQLKINFNEKQAI